MSVFDCLNRNTLITKAHFLEASAGTGKTFAIEHVVVRLLIEQSELLNIEQILIVTFTKAATKELKQRIRKNIEFVLSVLKLSLSDNIKTENIHFDYLLSYLEDKDTIADKISRLEEALIFFDQSSIYTIHGFCFRILQEFFLDAEITIKPQEEENDSFLKDYILDYLKYSIDTSVYSVEQIALLIKKYKDTPKLVNKLKNYIQRQKENDSKVNFSDEYTNFNNQLLKFDAVDIKLLCEDFEVISLMYKKINSELLDQLKFIADIVNNKKCTESDFNKLIRQKKLIFDLLVEDNKKKRAKNLKLNCVIFIEKAMDMLYPILKKIRDPKLIFRSLADDISKKIEEKLEEEEIYTPDKILNKTLNALKSKKFIQKVQEKYFAVIIDEFQDTDPIQYDIFKTIFFKNKDLLALYLIGDPKQSIYGFRKADLYTYLNAAENIGSINYLDTNYRSTPNLINSLNALFSNEFASSWLKLPKINKSLTYLPIKAGSDKSDIPDDKKPIHFFIAKDKLRTKKWPTEKIESLYFNFIASEIQRLQKGFSLRLNQFAVLVKDRYQAKRLIAYFEKHNIRYQSNIKSSLKNSIAIDTLKNFFEAVIYPNDINKIKIALGGAYIGLKAEYIKKFDVKNAQIIKKFYHLNKILLEKGLISFFNYFFKTSFNEEISLIEKLVQSKDLSLYQDTMQLMDSLIEKRCFTREKILSFFEKLELLDPDDKSLKIHQFDHEDAVQIMTIHLSKGLEFDVVFALGLVNRVSDVDEDHTQELDAEKARQLYVAMTRAAMRVYVPIAIDLQHKEIAKGSISAIEYFFQNILKNQPFDAKNIQKELNLLKNKGFISYSWLENDQTIFSQETNETIYLQSPTIVKPEKKSSVIGSFSSIAKKTKDNEVTKKAILPASKETGIVLHSILEKIIFSKTLQKDHMMKIIENEIMNSELHEFSNEIFQMIFKVFNTPFIEDQFCLKDVSFENMYVEKEFFFSIDNDYLKGFIDLFFFHNNKYYLIDWKSNFLDDYDEHSLKDAMEKNDYFLQGAIYTEALFRYLKTIEKRAGKDVFGGMYYIFLRGLDKNSKNGLFHFYPDLRLFKENSLCLN